MIDLIKMNLTIPSYLPLLFSFLLVIRWVCKARERFRLGMLGGIGARLFLFITYGIIFIYDPPAEDVRMLVRTGVTVLLFDELVFWIGEMAYKIFRGGDFNG
jgi:hypothetical protein